MAFRAMSLACARSVPLTCRRTVGRFAGSTLLFTGAGLHLCTSHRHQSKIIFCEGASAASLHVSVGSADSAAAAADEGASGATPHGDRHGSDPRASIQEEGSQNVDQPADQGGDLVDGVAEEGPAGATPHGDLHGSHPRACIQEEGSRDADQRTDQANSGLGDGSGIAACAEHAPAVGKAPDAQDCHPGRAAELEERCMHEEEVANAPKEKAPVQPTRPSGRALSFGNLLHRLVEILGWNCCLLVAGAMASMLKVAMSLLTSSSFGSVMNALEDEAALRSALSRLVAIQLAKAVLDFVQGLLLDAGLDVLEEKLRFALFESLLHQDAAFFDAHAPMELTSKFSSEVGKVRSFVRTLSTDTLETVTGIAGNIVELIRKSPSMCKRTVLTLIPGFSVFGVLLSFIRASNAAVDAAIVKVNSTVLESLVNIRTVQSFVAEEQELEKYTDKREKFKSAQGRLRFWKQTLSLTGTVWFSSIQALILFTASGLVRAGSISSGTVSSLFLHLFALMGACGKLLGLLQAISIGTVATRSIFATLDEQPTVRCETAYAEPGEALTGAVEFHSVHFQYPTRPDEEVLRGVSLSLAPGSHVALVGASGSGKSTLGWLAQRFYDCNQGAVHVDGKDVRQLSPQWLKRHIAYVEQEPALFSGTIRQNIHYGRPGASQAEVTVAADAALVSDFAQVLPGGLDTEVGDSGAMLSGGQKQRVAIARALLKDPRILILDEATSALDSGTEQQVQEALKRTMAGRTTLVIAHRLSTVRGADRIVVLDRGTVVEVGTHQELMSMHGPYSKFVQQQEHGAAESV